MRSRAQQQPLPPDTHPPCHSWLWRLDRLSALVAPQKAEIENVVIMLFMKLASQGRSTIEKPPVPPIRINTHQAGMLRLHGAQGKLEESRHGSARPGGLQIIIIILFIIIII